ncbi:hypothetical protein D3C76_1445980 [compost metagenome]
MLLAAKAKPPTTAMHTSVESPLSIIHHEGNAHNAPNNAPPRYTARRPKRSDNAPNNGVVNTLRILAASTALVPTVARLAPSWPRWRLAKPVRKAMETVA